MNKTSITNFIDRYNLGGEVESVKIFSTDDMLSVNFISDDKTLLGNVTSTEKRFPNGEFGVYATSQFKSLLSVLDEDVNVRNGDGTLKMSDDATAVNFVLSDLSVIPSVPELKQLPNFEAELSLDNEFVTKFIKAKSALPHADTFTFVSVDGVSEIILGYSSLNTNRVSIKVNANVDGDVKPISFNSNYLKQVLIANRGSEQCSMKISSQGLSHLSFKTDTFTTNYYLVQIQ
tara:strand:+ start:333 stop:1028 length:696 start_codon:yes stop_codon:yes gene_type:complete